MDRKKYYYTTKFVDGQFRMVGVGLPEELKTKFFSELQVGDRFWIFTEPNRTYEKVADTVLHDGWIANARNTKTGKYIKVNGFLDREVAVVNEKI